MTGSTSDAKALEPAPPARDTCRPPERVHRPMTDADPPDPPDPIDASRRAIRSFVRRAGRITPAQTRALETFWPRYGIDYDGQPLDLDALFGRHAPRTVEIGFGDGESLVALAAARPERDFLGLEVHEPGVGHCLLRAAALELGNLRVIAHDAVEVLERALAPGSLDEVLVYFPDPWPKTRHHKRRFLQMAMLDELARVLVPGAELRFATDDKSYLPYALERLLAHPKFEWLASGPSDWLSRPADWPPTRYETKAIKGPPAFFRFARKANVDA